MVHFWFYLWFSLTYLIWFVGLFGHAAHYIPLAIALLILARHRTWGPFVNLSNYKNLPFSRFKGLLLTVFGVALAAHLLKAVLRLYSFQWHVLDVGSYSIRLFNLTQGRIWNSYEEISALADHFIPTMGLFAPFYALTPTAHWISIAKVLAYFSLPLMFYLWLKVEKIDAPKRFWLAFGAGLYLILGYAPMVNGLNFEFSPSVLALPLCVLLYIFLKERRFIVFTLTALLMLGLKEHLGVVLIGLGCHEFLNRNPRLGLGLAAIGTGITAWMIFVLMPSLQIGHEDLLQGISQIAPFKDLHLKAAYLFWCLLPLGFIPLFGWRHGILAAPAIAVNLISGRPNMYSLSFQYHDVSSTLLMMSCILVWIDWEKGRITVPFSKLTLRKALFGVILTQLFVLPPSPLRQLRRAIPTAEQLALVRTIRTVETAYPEASIASLGNIMPLIHRFGVKVVDLDTKTSLQEDPQIKCRIATVDGKPVDLIILPKESMQGTFPYLEDCLETLLPKLDPYQEVEAWENMHVFKHEDFQKG